MEQKATELTKSYQIDRQNRNKQHVANITNRLLAYYADKEKEIRRINLHLCKYCSYFNINRIGLSAMTTKPCANCGQEMLFPSSDTDVLCGECAGKLNVCKHCGQEMD